MLILSLVAVILIALTACGGSEDIVTPLLEQESIYESTAQESAGVTESSHTSNPFATPLLEFFAGGVQLPEYYEENSTMAILLDMDGNGDYIVVAVRHVWHDDGISTLPNYRIFRMDNSYLDIGNNNEHRLFITLNSEGLPIISIHPADTVNSWTPIVMENGDLIFPFTLQRRWDDGKYLYNYIKGGVFLGEVPEGMNFVVNWDDRRYIAEEEFDDIMYRYNLEGSWIMMLDDETEAILAMTV